MPHKNPEAAKAYWQAYRAKPENKEKQRRWKANRHARMRDREWRDHYYDANLRRLYGITIDDYHRLLDEQEHRCAICRKHQDDEPRRLAVDHCHKTHVVRGLLCQHCNHAIGKFLDCPDRLRRAAEYLEQPREPHEPAPSRIWGKPNKFLMRQPGGVNDPARPPLVQSAA